LHVLQVLQHIFLHVLQCFSGTTAAITSTSIIAIIVLWNNDLQALQVVSSTNIITGIIAGIITGIIGIID